jgi:hypothetical protein
MPLRAFDIPAFEDAPGGLHRLRSCSPSTTKGKIMANATKAKRKVSLSPITADVRSGPDGTVVLFDVTFRCAFAPSKTDGVRLGHKEVLMLMQLAESCYPEIVGLLANKPKAKRQGR